MAQSNQYIRRELSMILIDIGNTSTVLGIYFSKRIINLKRVKTSNSKEFILCIDRYVKKFKKNNLCILSSVVPRLNPSIKSIVKKYKLNFFNINAKNIPLKINFKYDLKKIGADRIANTVAVINNNINNSIIVDFGTATTFDVIKNNVYEGGLIFPGINISHESLINNTSMLKKIKVIKIKKLVSNNTKQSIQSGFYWGYLSVINGIIDKIIKEKKFKPKIILTGGYANIFKSGILLNPTINENLTLEGLVIIGKKINVK